MVGERVRRSDPESRPAIRMSQTRFSIVIPTRNGGATLPALLDRLWDQRITGLLEILAVDSGSTDGTVQLLRSRNVTVLPVSPGAFDHGETRNLAIARARGDFVVLLVQDALPVGGRWLETLVRPLVSDSTLAGTFARQQPRQDASAIATHYLERWVASSPTARTVRLPGGLAEFDRWSPGERLTNCAFDNVSACIRRSVWERYPFKATRIAEDLEWARDVLLAGYGLTFVPDAVVEHSHDRSPRYEYLRTRDLHARLWDLFGLETIPTKGTLAWAMLSSAARHLWLERQRPGQWPRALGLAVAWPLGQFRGARLAREAAVNGHGSAG
jgi:rhamnosyltransferase